MRIFVYVFLTEADRNFGDLNHGRCVGYVGNISETFRLIRDCIKNYPGQFLAYFDEKGSRYSTIYDVLRALSG